MSIHMDVENLGVHRDDDDGGWEHTLWQVQLVRYHNADTPEGIEDSRDQAVFHTEFRTGMAHGLAHIEDVLESLMMDFQSVRYSDGVDDWISEYGFEITSVKELRKLEADYAKIEEQAKRFAEFIGGQDVLDRFLDMDSDQAVKEMMQL